MKEARIRLTDGTVVEGATKLRIRPAELLYLGKDGKEGKVTVNAVQQVEVLREEPDPASPKKKVQSWGAPREEDIEHLPL